VRELANDAIDTDSVSDGVYAAMFDSFVPAEGYAADGVMVTVGQLLCMIYACVAQYGVTGTSLEVRQLDGITPAMTFTLDDAAAPTTRARTS